MQHPTLDRSTSLLQSRVYIAVAVQWYVSSKERKMLATTLDSTAVVARKSLRRVSIAAHYGSRVGE